MAVFTAFVLFFFLFQKWKRKMTMNILINFSLFKTCISFLNKLYKNMIHVYIYISFKMPDQKALEHFNDIYP